MRPHGFSFLILSMIATTSALSVLADQPCTAESLFGVKDDPNSPVSITVSVKSADLKDGIRLQVEIKNKRAEPLTLHVCPAMLMCCVKGLHPIVAFDETGIGLLDLYKEKSKPAERRERKVVLSANEGFSFDVLLPPDRLPEACRKKGKQITVLLCYELGEGRLVHSKPVKVSMK